MSESEQISTESKRRKVQEDEKNENSISNHSMDVDEGSLKMMNERRYIEIGEANENINEEEYSTFMVTVMSYNILADFYASTEYFPYCPPEFLEIGYRREKILDEIIQSNADIICLQECELELWDTFLKPRLFAHGFQSYLCRQYDYYVGVAIFYRSFTIDSGPQNVPTFRMKSVASFHIPDLAEREYRSIKNSEEIFPDGNSSSSFMQTLLTKGGPGLGILFEEEESKQSFWVATTHLFWNPQNPDVKTSQCALLCKELEKSCIGKDPSPLILAGDFNSIRIKMESDEYDPAVPTEGLRSGVYEICVAGTLPETHPHHPITHSFSGSAPVIVLKEEDGTNLFGAIEEQEEENPPSATDKEEDGGNPPDTTDKQEGNPPSTTIHQGVEKNEQDKENVTFSSKFVPNNELKLIDAFDTSLLPAPFYTNYTQKFKAQIDHIFYSNTSTNGPKKLLLNQILGGYSLDILNQHTALPSKLLPSDHIPVIAKFAFQYDSAAVQEQAQNDAAQAQAQTDDAQAQSAATENEPSK